LIIGRRQVNPLPEQKQEAQLLQRDYVTIRVIEYFAKDAAIVSIEGE